MKNIWNKKHDRHQLYNLQILQFKTGCSITRPLCKVHDKKMWSHASTIIMFIINITATDDCKLIFNMINYIDFFYNYLQQIKKNTIP